MHKREKEKNLNINVDFFKRLLNSQTKLSKQQIEPHKRRKILISVSTFFLRLLNSQTKLSKQKQSEPHKSINLGINYI